MISTESINNIKYFSKYTIIILIIFFILKFGLNTNISEAILLAFIIGVTIIIIENIISINTYISDPLNCDQCKINLDTTKKDKFTDSNINANLENNSNHEDFESNLLNIPDFNNINNINEMAKNFVNNISNNIPAIVNSANNLLASPTPIPTPTPTVVPRTPIYTDYFNNTNEDVDNIQDYINQQSEINNNIIENFDTTNQPTNIPTKVVPTTSVPTTSVPTTSVPTTSVPTTSVPTTSVPTTSVPTTSVPTTVQTNNIVDGNIIQNKSLDLDPSNTINHNDYNKIRNSVDAQQDFNFNDSTINTKVENAPVNTVPSIDPSFDANYVQYQQDGKEAEAANISMKTNLFKLNMGDKVVTEQYINDAKKYYDQILSYSTDAPSTFSAMENELKYSNYNYIGPLNKGMANKEYTFISPTNWYPIPPVPPVCVTNKSCTTCPVMISNGNDYMQWASLEDFDKARRFTGDMNINTDYIKNVLNNPNGY
jgi:hypothetical protein